MTPVPEAVPWAAGVARSCWRWPSPGAVPRGVAERRLDLAAPRLPARGLRPESAPRSLRPRAAGPSTAWGRTEAACCSVPQQQLQQPGRQRPHVGPRHASGPRPSALYGLQAPAGLAFQARLLAERTAESLKPAEVDLCRVARWLKLAPAAARQHLAALGPARKYRKQAFRRSPQTRQDHAHRCLKLCHQLEWCSARLLAGWHEFLRRYS
mmetsp:Transcript_116151/g.375304  ORF Transcript_116151/g.375304 Transcript_116151/m.375304 type:complete len:210 (-) Transcript_116151:376-1005(-)